MGEAWDGGDIAFTPEIWVEALRVAKPGAHLLAFGGTRTCHRLVVAIEDAGWEIRDTLMWVYGQGFPKSLDVSKAIDSRNRGDCAREKIRHFRAVRNMTRLQLGTACGLAAPESTIHDWEEGGHSPSDANWQRAKAALGITPDEELAYERKVVGQRVSGIGTGNGNTRIMGDGNRDITAPATDAAKQWQGWGTALKPAYEHICLARKPLEGTVAQNIKKWGVGALNIDGCRIAGSEGDGVWGSSNECCQEGRRYNASPDGAAYRSEQHPLGRWPANLIHDGSSEVVGAFPWSSSGANPTRRSGLGYHGGNGSSGITQARGAEEGSAARLFYCAKASVADREEGLEGAEARVLARSCQVQAEARRGDVVSSESGAYNKARLRRNHHPTVKPTELMRWLCRLVTPPGGLILDMFAGSGSTGKAALLEGFRAMLVECSPEYADIARRRCSAVQPRLL
jgi:transcriptional regulator with XRE-family HTH domain